MSETQCSELVMHGYRSGLCSKPATVTEGGKRYCKQHAPSNVKAGYKAREAKLRAESDERMARHRVERAGAALLAACKAIVNDVGAMGVDWTSTKQCRAAIAARTCVSAR